MPYDTVGELPDAVQKLPAHGQEIYLKAFNSAFEQYKNRGDQREALAHATAWAAVKTKYKQDKDGNWVAKESKEVTMPKLENQEEIARIMSKAPESKAIRDKALSKDNRKWAKEAYKALGEEIEQGLIADDDDLIFETIKKTAHLKSELEEKWKEPPKPIESLQSKYSEIIQEVGKRNATLDAARIKKIVELCQELLSSEEPDEEKAKEALKEADKALNWLKEQAAMKTEDGVKYPAAAFAYVPDTEKPSTWKLRLWQDPTNKVTRAQLGRAAAALSPGGFRGQKVQIPSADLPAVKRKIRAEYNKLGVDPDEVPKWVKEVETRELLLSYIPLTEAKIDKGRATVIVIKPGFNEDGSRYYPEEVLKRDYKIFEGQKMYADHPTEEEDKARPERSIKDWVATLTDVACDESGVVTGISEIIEPWMLTKLASLRDKGMLSEMGISINAVGSASKATIDGKETLVIEKLVAARSVDFVTEPGAGGVVTFYEADRHRDVDLVELSALRERRPDLIKAVEAEVRAEIHKEVKHKMELEERITELEGQIETLTTERDNLKTQMQEAEKAKAKAEAQAAIKEAVDKAELPDAAKERLLERFKDAESADGIEEAITAEVDYIAKLAEAGKVKGLGPSGPASEEEKKALRESFKKMHPEWTDAQLDTAVEGR